MKPTTRQVKERVFELSLLELEARDTANRYRRKAAELRRQIERMLASKK